METYQTLSLIGCIFGILLTIGLFLIMNFLMGASNVLFKMGRPSEEERLQHENKTEVLTLATGRLFLSFLLYIAILVITFAVKSKIKLVGIVILVLGVITTGLTNLWGIIPFALLLPAGIVALRYKGRYSRIPG